MTQYLIGWKRLEIEFDRRVNEQVAAVFMLQTWNNLRMGISRQVEQQVWMPLLDQVEENIEEETSNYNQISEQVVEDLEHEIRNIHK